MRCCEDRGHIAQALVDHGCRNSTYYHHIIHRKSKREGVRLRDRKHEDSGREEKFSIL